MAQPENWLSIDEAEDVLGSAKHALLCYDRTEFEPLAWKWFALSIHSLLQGACVCHLVTSASPVGACTKTNEAEWLIWFEESRDNPGLASPKTRLASLPELLKRIRKANSAGDRSNQNGIEISDSNLAWLCSFHEEIRNQFVHFEPRGWALEVSGLPELSKVIAGIAAQISEIGYAFRHKDAEWKRELRHTLLALANFETKLD